MAKNERVYLTTPAARLCFPSLLEPTAANDKAEPKFEATLLFDPETFTQKDRELLKKIEEHTLDALTEEFGPKAVKDRATRSVNKNLHYPIGAAEDKVTKAGDPYDGFIEGRKFLKAKSKYKPKLAKLVRGEDGKPRPKEITESDEIERLFYSGAVVRATVTPFAYDNVSKGAAFQLENIVFITDGERLGGGAGIDVEEAYDDAAFDDYADELNEDEGDDDDLV